jgi:hypothetical protein
VTALAAMVVAVAAAAGGGDLSAGPVMAGDGAAWAERMPSGAVRVLTRQPGGKRVVRRRWAAPRGAYGTRSIPSIAADGRRLAAVVSTCTPQRRVSTVYPCVDRAFAGPFARLRGPRLPERVPTPCPDGSRHETEVATGGGWTAMIVQNFCPIGGGVSALRREIEVRGPRTLRIPLRGGGGLRLAGDYLTWTQLGGGVVLYDLRKGERVLRLGDNRGSIGAHDVQADGTLALSRYAPMSQICVSTVTPAGVEQRIACRYEEPTAGSDAPGARTPAVAISAGRVLYLRGGTDLIVQRPGGEPRLITRFTVKRLRAGEFGLGPRSVVWAEQRSDGAGNYLVGPRVVLEHL